MKLVTSFNKHDQKTENAVNLELSAMTYREWTW